MQCRIADMRCKEVINVNNGFRLGFVSDVIFDVVSGKILSLVVPGPYRFLGILGRCEDYVIPWGAIRKIGDDIILVESDCSPRCDKRQKRQWI